MEFEIKNCKVVLLDFFEKKKKIILKELKTKDVKTFLEPLNYLTIIFSDLKNNSSLKKYVKEIDLPNEYLEELMTFFDGSFQSSFSWGFDDREFVFIRLEENTKLFHKKNRPGLRGLIIHEVLHGVQRQRGLEIRLRDSLDFTLDFFTQLAEVIPPEEYDRAQIISFLKRISQIALFVLKDIFVNVELIKRELGSLLIIFYKDELGYDEKLDITPPHFETEFDKGKIRIKDLDSFAEAFTYTISLIPVWLPFMVLETESKDYEITRKLKHFIFEKYYTNPSLITREMWHLENSFLTGFSFSMSFHRKWYGAIFNLALEYLLGEDFTFYHLFKATELIEELYSDPESEERKSMAIIPILKAAHVHKREKMVGIQERNVEELDKKIKQYNIEEAEISELEESIDDPEESGHTSDHAFENLLKLSIMILSRDLRVDIYEGKSTSFKDYCRTILSLLQAINYLGDECDDVYYHTVRLEIKRLLRTDSVFKRKRQALLLENYAQNIIFKGEFEPEYSELEELLFNYDFFEIPLTNINVELGVSFIQNLKTVMDKVPVDDDEFPLLAGQFINMFLGEHQIPVEDEEHLNLVYVSSLIATKGINYNLIQQMLVGFIQTKVKQKE
ncbi:MAG: hypothetical protein ACW97P_07855 [Candidatus Hodarchaeales archaeon]|jgi:hypothetical protein